MPIKPHKWDKLHAWMEELSIREEEIEEKFILGSGKGGQKMNKTASCVYLKHLPTGVEVKCQAYRDRELNRYSARELLCEEVDYRLKGESSKRALARAKVRKQKQKRIKRGKEKYET